MKHVILIILFFFATLNSKGQDILNVSAYVDRLLNEMTLEEKIGQMNQYSGFFDATGPSPKKGNDKLKYEHIKKGLVGSMLNVRGAEQVRALQKLAVENSRLGIPMLFAFDVIHGYETIMPIPLAEAASWDLEAIQNSARLAANEATAAGINWTFAPMVDISRDPRWGRVMEGAGEDPYLGSRIATARIKGFQEGDLRLPNTLAACAKHFAAYGFVESGKEYNTVDISQVTLNNAVFPPFRAAVQADVCTFMNSFSQLNGIPATGDAYLQRDILKGKWEFDGPVISDWGSIMELEAHGYARDMEDASRKAVLAGSDIDMESHAYIKHLKALVESNKIDLALIDDAVRRILHLKEKLGLFEDPYLYCKAVNDANNLENEDHQAIALDMAKKSIVLLKNEKNLLPLPTNGKKIAVIGQLATDKNSVMGNWRLASVDHSAVSLLEGLRQYPGNSLDFEQGVQFFNDDFGFAQHVEVIDDNRTGFMEAKELARKSDIVLMVLGEHGFQSGEGRSRTKLNLPGLQQELLKEVFAINKNVVLILMNGRPLALDWEVRNIPAILETWHLGTQAGNAIAAVLFGDYNPSGKLPMTFPRSVGQIPIYYNHKKTGRPVSSNNVFWSHYEDEVNSPLFPFGYGLSYTHFEYSNLKVSMEADNIVAVEVKVENAGAFQGEEVVQLYINDKFASITRPIRELKGFKKISLQAGESKVVKLILSESELGFYDRNGVYKIEPGEFDVFVGGDSNASLKATFWLK